MSATRRQAALARPRESRPRMKRALWISELPTFVDASATPAAGGPYRALLMAMEFEQSRVREKSRRSVARREVDSPGGSRAAHARRARRGRRGAQALQAGGRGLPCADDLDRHRAARA